MSARRRVAIMQPYFLPYLGYWQLLNCVDTFVVYDDVQFTKKGWIHRNRFLQNGADQMFSLPLKKDSDYLDVMQRQLAASWPAERAKLLRKIAAAYHGAPNAAEGMAILEACVQCPDDNLFEFVAHSIQTVQARLGIATEVLVSSRIGNTREYRGQERVLAICESLGATEYVNPIGGLALYEREAFARRGVNLRFHRIGAVRYPQPQAQFVPNLSVLDMLMQVGVSGVKDELDNFEWVV